MTHHQNREGQREIRVCFLPSWRGFLSTFVLNPSSLLISLPPFLFPPFHSPSTSSLCFHLLPLKTRFILYFYSIIIFTHFFFFFNYFFCSFLCSLSLICLLFSSLLSYHSVICFSLPTILPFVIYLHISFLFTFLIPSFLSPSRYLSLSFIPFLCPSLRLPFSHSLLSPSLPHCFFSFTFLLNPSCLRFLILISYLHSVTFFPSLPLAFPPSFLPFFVFLLTPYLSSLAFLFSPFLSLFPSISRSLLPSSPSSFSSSPIYLPFTSFFSPFCYLSPFLVPSHLSPPHLHFLPVYSFSLSYLFTFLILPFFSLSLLSLPPSLPFRLSFLIFLFSLHVRSLG